MMISDRGILILSPSDVSASTACEFGWLRQADAKLGRVPRVRRSDAMQERLAKLGATHEKRVTDALRENAGTYETIGRPAYPVTEAKIAAAASNTRRHAHGGVDVISQAVLFDGQTYGIADFLIKQSDGSYSVWDAKLARSAKTSARLQLATYADLLDQAGIARHRTAGLFLGSGKSLEIELDDLLPEVRARLTAARQLMTKHVAQSEVVAWESGGLSICGKCEHCAVEIEANDDVLLVHNLRRRDREHLRASGITTVQELASSNSTVEGLKEERWRTLRAQAAIQTRQVVHPDGSVTVAYEVFDPTPILNLPSPEAGDIFFDFEGDTMFEGDDSDLGIEYLWGLLELDGTSTGSFTPLWADDRATERDALVTFFDHLSHRRIDHPDMHVYHYASYEISALRRLCQRHAVGAACLL